MKTSLYQIASQAKLVEIFNKSSKELGFSSTGEVDRFIFGPYKEVIRITRPADRPRGTFFVLEPASIDGKLCNSSPLNSMLLKIKSSITTAIYSIRIDLEGGLCPVCKITQADRKSPARNGWKLQTAQQFSRDTKKCVIWAMGVSVYVIINGDIYKEVSDVIEELCQAIPSDFQKLSWDDGGIAFEFADGDLNDRGPLGIWQLPNEYLLKPKPEVLIRYRFGKFLQFRLAGYNHHDEEPIVQHEGAADISLHLIDGRIFLVEIKWIGISLIGKHKDANKKEIKAAIKSNIKGWLTKYDDRTISSGVRQLVRYYKTGRYDRSYLTVFDCAKTAQSGGSCYMEVPEAELEGHNKINFRIIRACVDPRSASRRSR